jgi:Tfp pilus assembly protein FimV
MLEEASAQVAQQAAALSSMGEETDSKAAELAAAQVRQRNQLSSCQLSTCQGVIKTQFCLHSSAPLACVNVPAAMSCGGPKTPCTARHAFRCEAS